MPIPASAIRDYEILPCPRSAGHSEMITLKANKNRIFFLFPLFFFESCTNNTHRYYSHHGIYWVDNGLVFTSKRVVASENFSL